MQVEAWGFSLLANSVKNSNCPTAQILLVCENMPALLSDSQQECLNGGSPLEWSLRDSHNSLRGAEVLQAWHYLEPQAADSDALVSSVDL